MLTDTQSLSSDCVEVEQSPLVLTPDNPARPLKLLTGERRLIERYWALISGEHWRRDQRVVAYPYRPLAPTADREQSGMANIRKQVSGNQTQLSRSVYLPGSDNIRDLDTF